MKVSEVNLQTIKDSIGISDNDSNRQLEIYKAAAFSYIQGYTGLAPEEIDKHEDITIAFLCLIGDMYFNREATVQNDKQNPTVKQILAMYAVNYL